MLWSCFLESRQADMNFMTSYRRRGLERSRTLLTLLFVMGIAHWLLFFYLVFPEGGDSRLPGMLVSGAPVFGVEEFDAHDLYKELNYVNVAQKSLSEGI
jgi:hypothetical protein